MSKRRAEILDPKLTSATYLCFLIDPVIVYICDTASIIWHMYVLAGYNRVVWITVVIRLFTVVGFEKDCLVFVKYINVYYF